jgi:hypothetical protein
MPTGVSGSVTSVEIDPLDVPALTSVGGDIATFALLATLLKYGAVSSIVTAAPVKYHSPVPSHPVAG